MAAMRIHFSLEDLARVRVAATNPVMETLFAFRYVHLGEPGLSQRWRADVRARIPDGSTALVLAPLLSSQRVPFDLYTLCGRTSSIESAVENLRGRTAEHLSASAALSSTRLPLPSWTRYIAAADEEWLDRLGTAIRGAHQAIVEPYWPQIHARLNAERAEHGRTLLNFGVEHLLAHLHPAVRWRSPVLEIHGLPDCDRHLRGRGMVVILSMFCRPLPMPVRDYSQGQDEPPDIWLFVPAATAPHTLLPPLPDAPDERALATLLGRTRAAVLRAVSVGPVTTSGLARQVGVSIPAASQQAGVLRDAGLIATRRVGKAVLHTTTTTGEALLAGTDH